MRRKGEYESSRQQEPEVEPTGVLTYVCVFRDSELDGTGIETSLTGTFKLTVIKAADFTAAEKVLDFPLGETATEFIVHG
jgi:hypothetical protein